jgi:hypothetical protein
MADKTAHAAKAHKAAMAHVNLLTDTADNLRKEPLFARQIDAMMNGTLLGWDPQMHSRFSPHELVRLGDLLGEIAVSELWKRNGRICYDLHEELADALYRSRMSAVPGALFDRIPHINPMVVLPDPWPIGGTRGGLAAGYVRTFFIIGRKGDGICNSNDPDRDGLALLFCYDVVDEETGEIVAGPHRDLIPLPTNRQKFTAADVVRFAEEWQGGNLAHDMAKEAVQTFRPILEKAFAVLTYLCTDNRDVDEPPEWLYATRKKTGKGRKAADREPFWVRVGWYVGPQLYDARRRAHGREKGGVSVPSGVEYGPQHRAGHFKTVWFGPGKSGQRTQSTTVWVEPYWTKLEDLPEDVDPPTQIVPVGAQRKDPLRRRGTIGK